MDLEGSDFDMEDATAFEKIRGEFFLYLRAMPKVRQIKQQIEAKLRIPANIQQIKFGEDFMADDDVLYVSQFTLEVIGDQPASSSEKDKFTVYEVASEFAITVNSSSTVKEIKQQIEEARKIPASQQKITFVESGAIPSDNFPVPAPVFGERILLNRINEGTSTSTAPQAVFPCEFTVHYAYGNFPVTVDSLLMVREIKTKIEEQLHISAAKQNLMLLDNDVILRDDEFVSPYTVGSNLKLEITEPVSDLFLNLQLMKISDLLVPAEFSVGELKKMLRGMKGMARVGFISVYADEVELDDSMYLKDRRFSQLKVHLNLIKAPPQTLSIFVVHRSGPSTSMEVVQVDTNQTLWDVRKKLDKVIDFSIDHFFILQDDRVIRDGVTFGDFGVKSGDHLYLIKDKYETF